MKFTCIIYFIVKVGKKIEIMSSATQNSTNPANWKWKNQEVTFFFHLASQPGGGDSHTPVSATALDVMVRP